MDRAFTPSLLYPDKVTFMTSVRHLESVRAVSGRLSTVEEVLIFILCFLDEIVCAFIYLYLDVFVRLALILLYCFGRSDYLIFVFLKA